MNHHFAQTNLQLLNQMHRQGYSSEDMSLVLRAYDLAARLLTARYRGSGKTFIAHLVGTASILAALRAPAALVVAGLIHAAYESGDFGDGVEGISDARRNVVKSIVGIEAEEYVARYTALRWSERVMREMHDEVNGLSPKSRAVLLMRLANELEDSLDLGILYCGREKRRTADYEGEKGRILMAIANQLGFGELARAMESAFEAVARAGTAPVVPPARHDFSYLVAPLSYQRLMDAMQIRLAKIDAEGKTNPRRPAEDPGEKAK